MGVYYVATHISLTMGFRTAAMLRTYQVAGLAFIFIPSNVLCYAGIPREKSNQVASMMNFVRNIGGSIGIAMVSTLVTRATQRRQVYLSANMQQRQSALPRHGGRYGGDAAQPGNERGGRHASGLRAHGYDDAAAGRRAGVPRR